ncbi:hypothetical protein VNI00_017199 [Paramarasmius palmivorus]|uniref:Uncharacterized protein n=1 Tax=Paramarasmius palmivorus TaxID=297713 RepID=A0AAW0B801_9AGAR
MTIEGRLNERWLGNALSDDGLSGDENWEGYATPCPPPKNVRTLGPVLSRRKFHLSPKRLPLKRKLKPPLAHHKPNTRRSRAGEVLGSGQGPRPRAFLVPRPENRALAANASKRAKAATKLATRIAELHQISQEREARVRAKDLARGSEVQVVPVEPVGDPQGTTSTTREESPNGPEDLNVEPNDNDKLARKRHQQAHNSRRYYERHRSEIRTRVKERRARRVKQALILQSTTEEERNSVLEAKRRKQREYSRRHREANRSIINARERERRQRAK